MNEKLEQLVEALGIRVVTEEDLKQERIRLEQELFFRHGVLAHEISDHIRRGTLSETDDLVEQWISVTALAL